MFLNNSSTLQKAPQKIISVVPSQTELLFSLGLDKEVVGITKFCVHPNTWYSTKTRIGGTKNLDLDKIDALQPDLIIANKEENIKLQIELLAKKYPVWVSDINNFDDAIKMIENIGILTHKPEKSFEIIEAIQSSFSNLKPFSTLHNKAIYLIWNDPFMTVGGDTFISDLLLKIGFANCFEHSKRYPTITIKDLQQNKPDFVFLSSEPYPFKEKHILELKEQLPASKIILVDGEMLSWYGSRLIHAAPYFNQLLEKC